MTAAVIGLGCPKNQVDSELILGRLGRAGFVLTDDLSAADVVVINTCGFLQSAVDEARARIAEVVTLKRRGTVRQVYVVGCLVQRAGHELARALPDVDGFIGIDHLAALPRLLRRGRRVVRVTARPVCLPTSRSPRLVSTPRHYAYLRIADGCDNRCAYCLVPELRGALRCRAVPDLVREARQLVQAGVHELILVAQDTTAFRAPDGTTLAGLVRRLDVLPGVGWLRLLYTHPAHYRDDLFTAWQSCPHLLRYVDLPLQHVSDSVLERMGRPYRRADIERLLDRLPARDGFRVRVTFIVGFPGETERDFQELLRFVRTHDCYHLAAFRYSPEPGTPAARMAGQVSPAVKQARYDRLLTAQARRAAALRQALVGTVVSALVDGPSGDRRYPLCGRTVHDAPEVDGRVYLRGSAAPGQLGSVRIERTTSYDLYGHLENGGSP